MFLSMAVSLQSDVSSRVSIKPYNEVLKEIWDVKELPFKLGFFKPSLVIERLLSNRRREHENALESLKNSIFISCKDYNQYFQTLCRCLKMKVENVRHAIQNQQNQFLKKNLSEIRKEDFSTVWNFVHDLVHKEKSIFNHNFAENVRILENNRRERSKSVFMNCYKALMEISYLLPSDIKILMGYEICNYNRIVLQHQKAYECLHLEIHFLFNALELNFDKWMEDLKIKINDVCRLQALDMLKSSKEELKCAESIFLNSDKGKIIISTLRSKKNLISDLLWQWKIIVPFSTNILNEKFLELEKIILTLDTERKKTLESYSLILKTVLNQFCWEVEDFNKINKESITKEADDGLINEIVEEIKNKYDEVLSTVDEEWENIMRRIKETAKETFAVLNNFASLWNGQLSQIAEMQNKVLHSLENIKTKNDKEYQSFKAKWNIDEKDIRQGINEVTLKKELDKVNLCLNRIEKKFQSCLQEELKIIQIYNESIIIKLSLLKKKIDELVEVNDHEKNIFQFVDNYFEEAVDEKSIMINEIRSFKKEISAILHWKFEILNNVKLHRSELIKNFRSLSELWRDSVISICEENLKHKLQIHEQQCKEVLKVYKVRIEEIKSHNNNLEEHKKAVDDELKEISARPVSFWVNMNNHLKNYEQEIIEIFEESLKAKEINQMKYFRAQINRKRRNYENLLKSEAESLKTEIKNKFLSVNKRNEFFFREIKLFKDGGNYNFEEAKIVKNVLTVLKTSIQKAETSTLSQFVSTLNEMISQIDKREKEEFDKSKSVMQNLEFMDFVTNIMNKCCNFTEIKLKDLVNSHEKLIQDIKNIAVVFKNKLLSQIPLKPMLDDWMQLLDVINDQFEYLKIPFPELSKSEFVVRINNKSKAKKREFSKSINERNVLTDSIDSKDENKLSSFVIKNLSKSLTKIEEKSLDHLSKMAKNSTLESYTEFNYYYFMQKVQEQLYFYYVDAKKVWAQGITDFFIIVKNCKKITQKWVLSIFTEYNSSTEQSIISKKTYMLKMAYEMIKDGSQKRSKNRQSIKVTYGFPKNKQHLENLNENVREEENKICEEAKKTYQTEQFNELFNVYKVGLVETAQDLTSVLNKLKIVDNIIEFELKLIDSESKNFIKIENSGDDSNKLNKPKNKKISDSQVQIKNGTENEKLREKSIFKYMEFRQLENKNKIIFADELIFDYEQNEHFNTVNFFDAKSINFSSKMKDFLENSTEKIQKMCSEAANEMEKKIKSFLLEGTEFLSWWQTNIDSISEVYELGCGPTLS